MSSTAFRHYLENLARRGQLSRSGLQLAFKEAGIWPNAQQWARFMDVCLLVAGSVLSLAGILFFFAYNWDELHRFAKIALVLAPLVASALLALQSGIDQLRGKALLSAAIMLTGVLLAVLGQIYQTGADSEWLFIGWAMLVLPWVLIARLPWLWAFWLSLLNVVLELLFIQHGTWWPRLTQSSFYPFFLLNAVALLVWESLASLALRSARVTWMLSTFSLMPRFVMLLLSIAVTGIGIEWWWRDTLPYALFIYLAWFGLAVCFYRLKRRDIFPLALLGLSCIAFATSGMIYALSKNHATSETSLLLLTGIVLIGLTGGLAMWLRQTSLVWAAAEMAEEHVKTGETHV